MGFLPGMKKAGKTMIRLALDKNKIYQGNLLLVNGNFPIMRSGEKDLIPADMHFPEILMRHDAALALQQVLLQIGSADRIVPVSGYRSREEQTAIYKESLKENQIYYAPAKEDVTLISMPDREVYRISGNNTDGFIVTVWRRKV